MDVHDDLVVVASSRLEGSTWDGAVTILRARAEAAEGNDMKIRLTPEAGHVTEFGISSVAWCGLDARVLAVAQDNGDVEVGINTWPRGS